MTKPLLTSEKTLTQLKTTQLEAETQRKVIEQVLHEKIQPLEHAINHQKATLLETNNNIVTQNQTLNNNIQQLSVAETEQQKASTIVIQQQAYLANNQALQQLPEKLPLWQSQYKQLTTQQASVQSLLSEQNNVEQTLLDLTSQQQVKQQQISECEKELQQLNKSQTSDGRASTTTCSKQPCGARNIG